MNRMNRALCDRINEWLSRATPVVKWAERRTHVDAGLLLAALTWGTFMLWDVDLVISGKITWWVPMVGIFALHGGGMTTLLVLGRKLYQKRMLARMKKKLFPRDTFDELWNDGLIPNWAPPPDPGTKVKP
jgi:hypothetical protein